MNALPYYIYLDSKIVGTAKQIVTFFENRVFSHENTLVLIKKYKDKSNRKIEEIFRQYHISYKFVLAKDLDELSEGVMFYPFNAQSNCRAVANRNLTHIFITHGESNKISSIKPIIRIYDYVLTAGQAGIDRFLTHGIFSQCDVDSGRLIKIGDTFIGKTGLSSSGTRCIIYAPTWEGGVEQENYSSLGEWQYIAKYLLKKIVEYQVDTVLIRSHPNIGHRLHEYSDYLFSLIKLLKYREINVVVFAPNLTLTWWQKFKWMSLKIPFLNSLKDFQAVFAICDISAIETQLLNENIPYELFMNVHKKNAMLKKQIIYREVDKWSNNCMLMPVNPDEYKKYLIYANSHSIVPQDQISILLTKLLGGKFQK